MDIKTRAYDIEQVINDNPMLDRKPELDIALRAAMRAGRKVLEIYQSGFDGTMKKEDGSPITEADLASHRILAEHLAATGHMIRSEEGEPVRTETCSDTIWIIDPLDGTSDFVDRTGEFTIMVALVRKKTPILGVVLWPTEGAAYVAQRGRGAFRYSEGRGWNRIRVTNVSTLPECRAVGSRHHLTDRERGFIKRLGIGKFTSIGSSLKVCMISSGEAEVYITTTDKMKEWDTAASHCIITEAGGKMTDVYGRDLAYNNGDNSASKKYDAHHNYGILATNGTMHDYMVNEYIVQSEQSAPSEK